MWLNMMVPGRDHVQGRLSSSSSSLLQKLMCLKREKLMLRQKPPTPKKAVLISRWQKNGIIAFDSAKPLAVAVS